jgi:hypothetical protein
LGRALYMKTMKSFVLSKQVFDIDVSKEAAL